MTSFPSGNGDSHKDNIRPQLFWFVVVGAAWVALVLLWPRMTRVSSGNADSPNEAQAHRHLDADGQLPIASRRFGTVPPRTPAKTAEEIVAGKVKQFGRNRRAIEEKIAHRLGRKDVPPEIAAFFDAIDKGDWDEINRQWKELWTHQKNHDRPDLDAYWPAVLDANGVAEQAHIWPAQKLLDYGNSILGSLRPGMVYVGGTDCGRFVPELLNETSDDPHMVITQNALAAPTYLDLLNELYGGQFNPLTKEDSQSAFDEYTADAQRRLQHDLDFPNEPKQVLPGENITMVDGKVQVSGDISVMAVNEKLLQMIMEKNPDLSFATEESFPLRGTYADALPLGPLMELNAQNDQNAFTADRAAQSVDYWRSATQTLLADPDVTGSSYALGAYSHDVNATANLLAAHNFTSAAEDVYKLASQIMPDNPYPVEGLAQVLVKTGQADQAQSLLDMFAGKYPGQRSAIEQAKSTILWTPPSQMY